MQSKAREQRGRNQEAEGVAITLMSDLCDVSLREIGAMFGGRDFAAVAQPACRTQNRAKQKRLAVSLTEIKQICQRIQT